MFRTGKRKCDKMNASLNRSLEDSLQTTVLRANSGTLGKSFIFLDHHSSLLCNKVAQRVSAAGEKIMEFEATDTGLESGFYQLLDLGAWEVTKISFCFLISIMEMIKKKNPYLTVVL